ncbi:type IV secretion protein Rhs [Faucicola mancuniensis]|uniref:type IV secretion protein Rhs n=1 Tax=Faucicola mancuniensis TaxID=1309795 RepID=UPI0039772D65
MLQNFRKKWQTFWQNRLAPVKSRPLTDGEKRMAKSVFGEHLQLDDIRLKTAWWVLKNYAVSPNGNIYYHPDDWQADFADLSLAKRAWLIHELTHVWQVQQGIHVFTKALFNRKYSYVLTLGKPFLAYGVEQQARIVEDFYIHKERSQNCDAFFACIPFLTKNT